MRSLSNYDRLLKTLETIVAVISFRLYTKHRLTYLYITAGVQRPIGAVGSERWSHSQS